MTLLTFSKIMNPDLIRWTKPSGQRDVATIWVMPNMAYIFEKCIGRWWLFIYPQPDCCRFVRWDVVPKGSFGFLTAFFWPTPRRLCKHRRLCPQPIAVILSFCAPWCQGEKKRKRDSYRKSPFFRLEKMGIQRANTPCIYRSTLEGIYIVCWRKGQMFATNV